jgi:hypothetical protein
MDGDILKLPTRDPIGSHAQRGGAADLKHGLLVRLVQLLLRLGERKLYAKDDLVLPHAYFGRDGGFGAYLGRRHARKHRSQQEEGGCRQLHGQHLCTGVGRVLWCSVLCGSGWVHTDVD